MKANLGGFMHRETAHTARRKRSLVIVLLALAIVAVFGIAAQQALALPTFTLAQKGIGPCQTCHTQDATHANTNHSALPCATCHVTNISTPPLPTACGSCHGGPSAILATTSHTTQGCGTTAGCHGVPAPVPFTTSVSLKVAPSSIKLKKTVAATGAVTPAADLVGIKVVLKAEIKVGSAWKAAKSGFGTVSATGAYSWNYKPAKKGTYRMTASIVATADYKGSKSPSRPFKVK
jgi:hypothetical protein